MFCATITKDTDYRFMALFVSHVHVFRCTISLVRHLKYSYSCCSSSSDLYDVCVTSGRYNWSFFGFFYVAFESLYWRCFQCWLILFFLLFLDTYSLSIPSPGCEGQCITIIFILLWSIFLSSSLVHFKNSPKYLILVTAQVFFPLVGFPMQRLVSRSFLVHLRYSFLLYLSSLLVWCCLLSIFLSTWRFPFLRAFWLFLTGSSIPSIICLFPLFIMNMVHFLCQIPFLYPECMILLFVIESPILFHFSQMILFYPCTWSWYFSFEFGNWFLPVYFLIMYRMALLL